MAGNVTEVSARDLCIRSINIGRFPDWMAMAFELLSRESPRDMLMNYVFPVADVLSVASQAVTVTLTTTAAVQLEDITCIGVLLQADPANANDALLGIGAPTPAHTLVAGASFSADIANTNMLFITGSGGAVTVTYTALQL